MPGRGIRAVAGPTLLLSLACSPADEPIQNPQRMPGASPFVYPETLWDDQVEGETVLMVHVTVQGSVDSAWVHESSGFAAFDAAAVAGARQLRFTPARQGTRRVPLWAKVPVRFVLDTTPDLGLTPPTFETRNE
jgi:TonB family protein